MWLTGCPLEDAVLVMVPSGNGHVARLFIEPPARPGQNAFFADSAHGELWSGPVPGAAQWSEALGIEVRGVDHLGSAMCQVDLPLVAGDVSTISRLTGVQLETCGDLVRTLAELRLIKDDWEIEQLRTAVRHTIEGFEETVSEIPRSIETGGERWLQGTFDRYARTVGNGTGYSTIVGSGPHAATLHWVRCDGSVNPGDLVLMDMGVEEHSLYTADVTRTFPVSGTFSSTQRAVHDLVEKAHRAALNQVLPGRIFSDFHVAAMEVIASGLHDWGLLPVSVDEALSPRGQHHRRWLACGVGHHLGLDVHDCSNASYTAYQQALLQAGMVITVEPGLYFHGHDLQVPPELRGIGVRIEDDILITTSGREVLSAGLPIDAAGIEDWVRQRQSAPGRC